jgi:hypothetical protein
MRLPIVPTDDIAIKPEIAAVRLQKRAPSLIRRKKGLTTA